MNDINLDYDDDESTAYTTISTGTKSTSTNANPAPIRASWADAVESITNANPAPILASWVDAVESIRKASLKMPMPFTMMNEPITPTLYTTLEWKFNKNYNDAFTFGINIWAMPDCKNSEEEYAIYMDITEWHEPLEFIP